MSTQVASVTYADVPGFPAGSKVDHVLVSIAGSSPASAQSQSVAPGTNSVVFSNVVPDSYTITVQAQDAAGNNFGSPVTGTFTATDTTVTLNLPSAVTVAQQ